MFTKKQIVSIWQSIALTNETLTTSVRALNDRLDSHQSLIQKTIDSLEKVSSLSAKNSDLLLETIKTLKQHGH